MSQQKKTVTTVMIHNLSGAAAFCASAIYWNNISCDQNSIYKCGVRTVCVWVQWEPIFSALSHFLRELCIVCKMPLIRVRATPVIAWIRLSAPAMSVHIFSRRKVQRFQLGGCGCHMFLISSLFHLILPRAPGIQCSRAARKCEKIKADAREINRRSQVRIVR